MCTVYAHSYESNPRNLGSPGDEDFHVLKFPHKLWRIVNECNTGAIQWGIYGKTILIDYNLFQAQYLECEVPKFKTRNMTSFVRQLNMYGFKKMQTQVRMNSSRCCNIHEFFHNYFRYGRCDLLDSVKRRPTPVKNPRVIENLQYQNQSRLDMCRAAFANALKKSEDRLHHNNRGFSFSNNDLGDGYPENVAAGFNIQVIPIEKSNTETILDTTTRKVTLEVSSDYQELVDMNPNDSDSKTESGDSSIEENLENNHAFEDYLTQEDKENIRPFPNSNSTNIENNYFSGDANGTLMNGNHSVQVKKGFDGSNYVIDLMVGCADDKIENVVSQVLEAELRSGELGQEMEIPPPECTILVDSTTALDEGEITLNDKDLEKVDFNNVDKIYDSISKTYFGF